ncbi:MarR family winged helix-turn-helix transcriptional regulator [Filimonas lacunae]|nr:MarR family transcriptional regulator [Filimonas lacunae]BAV07478.1 transcriptional regulator, MarR family [Filimonas lacunae]
MIEAFELQNIHGQHSGDIEGWVSWLVSNHFPGSKPVSEPNWEGKERGRSAESIINTLIVHLNRYARTYSRSAIADSEFSTQEEFIYLINLNAFGAMSKMQLIKKNIQEKPVGMQIINRLLEKNWIEQVDSATDKRSKVISINEKGKMVLAMQMEKIKKASRIVAGDLSHAEKMELIRLLGKLEAFHQPIYQQNLPAETLLDTVAAQHAFLQN